MQIIDHPGQLGAFRGGCFVPTMGALHEGHQSLIRAARRAADEVGGGGGAPVPVVVSIFVNPTQFGPHEDFARYPRDLAGDAALAEDAGADSVFAPPVEVVYPRAIDLRAPPLPPAATEPGLEDRVRPGHFAGVCQVVARLFDLAQPRSAFFGLKDYQQWRVLDEMVGAVHAREPQRWPGLRIIACPIVRDADGLALSSRNHYLSPAQRERALGLSRAFSAAAQEHSPSGAEAVMRSILNEHDLEVDYAAVRDASSLLPVDDLRSGTVALVAARVDDVRLIDNRALPIR